MPKIIAAAIIAKNRGQFGFPETGIEAGVKAEQLRQMVNLLKSLKPINQLPDSKYE